MNKHLLLSLAALLGLAGPAGAAPAAEPQALVARAVERIGPVTGPVLRITGSIQYHDPEQSRVPGGKPTFGGEAQFVQWRSLDGARSRTQWRMEALRPLPHKREYVELIDGGRGLVLGSDSMLPVKRDLTGEVSGHVMSRTRVAINQRELLRSAPDLLQRMARSPAQLAPAPAVTLGGSTLPALRYASAFGDMVVAFDPASGLPALIRQLDYDPIQADSDFDLRLADWREVAGWRYPFEQRYELNGKLVALVRLASVEAQPAPAGSFEHPALADAAEPAGGRVATDSFQWFFRKQGFAVLVDSDAIYRDTRQPGGLRLEPMAPSVWLATGGYYNSLVVALKDSLVVYDAPHELHAQDLLAELARQFPGKPVSHLVLTHHHMDHAGGLRSYVAQGATLVVGAGMKAFYTEALRRPTTLGLPALRTPQARSALLAPKIIEADGPLSLGDEGGVQAQAYPVLENLHAQGMLFGYVPGARLGFVSDIWSPGRPLPPASSEPGQNLVTLARSVQHWKLVPDRFAGGHGTVDAYAPVAALLR